VKQSFFYLQPDLVSTLVKLRPDMVINSSFSLNSLLGSLYAKLLRKSCMIWSEATSFSEKNRSTARRWYRKLLIRLNDAYIPSGIEAKDFLFSLGATDEQCFTAVDAIEDIRKRPDYERILADAKFIRSKQCGLVILFSGRLIECKGLDLLLDAYEKVQDTRNITLWVMGNGPLEKELKVDVGKRGLTTVTFLGFLGEREKWVYYLASDIFVLPTRGDVWGLVVNEAMLCGLPVICSKFAGCCSDLVEDDVTGFVVNPYETGNFVAALRTLISNDLLRSAMSESARKKACEYSIEESANGFLRAIAFCADHKGYDK